MPTFLARRTISTRNWSLPQACRYPRGHRPSLLGGPQRQAGLALYLGCVAFTLSRDGSPVGLALVMVAVRSAGRWLRTLSLTGYEPSSAHAYSSSPRDDSWDRHIRRPLTTQSETRHAIATPNGHGDDQTSPGRAEGAKWTASVIDLRSAASVEIDTPTIERARVCAIAGTAVNAVADEQLATTSHSVGHTARMRTPTAREMPSQKRFRSTSSGECCPNQADPS